ncbi:hypothetical protein ABAZ39_11555 [Azospirillum argentinense]|uniref:Tyr recombinase domain-containing protein n=1 Tax=Azospirillum argentinense TaxID=2970906 RepID=A0A060DEM2_9PROT|nr:gamma-mobile-trio recombinase GmtY [Azospirillum argentinense]AIB12616.1 hypothetical protein ABAZ39_11555 [Azospirillum argentinense]EZQ09404.1 integrase [Azospirillum argentinense]
MLDLNPPPFAHSRVEHLDAAGLPVISIILDGGHPFTAWAEYRDDHNLKVGSQEAHAAAIGLFIDFIAAQGTEFLDVQDRPKLFQAFADALVLGTIKGGNDPSDLFWLPRSQLVARRTVAKVTTFMDWLVDERGVQAVNPRRQATMAEQIAFWRAWRKVSSTSLLKHIKRRAQEHTTRTVRVRGHKPALPDGDAKAFPDDMFPDLLRYGFERRPQLRWTTYRDQLITLLLHHGGQRISQALQLWVDDVYIHPEDETLPVVRVYHPTDGVHEYQDPTTGRDRLITRAQYLQLVYGRLALTQQPGKRRVGFKDPKLDDQRHKFLTVYWNSQEAARAFLKLYRLYVETRPRIVGHPYLFVTPDAEPMTVHGYEKVHGAAVRRIGLVAAKHLGTTPHGHRHAYGRWLESAGDVLTRKVRQAALHHKSAFSQDVYTEADIAAVSDAMRAAEQRIVAKNRLEWISK